MSEATRLNEDIQESEAAAQDIARLEEEWRQLGEQTYDIASKYDLLRSEIAFNEALIDNLDHLLHLKHALDHAEETMVSEEVGPTAAMLVEVEARIASVKDLEGTAVIGLLRARTTELRRALIERLEKWWDESIKCDCKRKRLQIEKPIAGRLERVCRVCLTDFEQATRLQTLLLLLRLSTHSGDSQSRLTLSCRTSLSF